MSRYTYTRGTWSDGTQLPEWTDNEEFREYLDRIGYRTLALTIGAEHGSSIEIYEARNGGSFYANVTPCGSNCYEVFLPDFPSLMHFMKEFGAVFSAIGIESDQRDLLNGFEKVFRAYHGHDAHSVCRECAPDEWERRAREREARAKQKAGGAGET